MQILGRDGYFDHVAQLSAGSIISVRFLFRRYCERFSAELWSTRVNFHFGDELEELMNIQETLRYLRATGSMGCTHLSLGRCPFSSSRIRRGKEISLRDVEQFNVATGVSPP